MLERFLNRNRVEADSAAGAGVADIHEAAATAYLIWQARVVPPTVCVAAALAASLFVVYDGLCLH